MDRARGIGAALVGLACALAIGACRDGETEAGGTHASSRGGAGGETERVGRERGCPEGWSEGGSAQILCVEGALPVTRTIHGRECVACLPETGPEGCHGAWVPQGVALACGPGEEPAASGDGFCKRCVPQKGGCVADDGCIRGGCSGQLCVSRDDQVMSTCEWNDAYACYAQPFAHCACVDGACGWKETPELQACLGGTRPRE